jgi:uncharacterized protein (DUF433 family)
MGAIQKSIRIPEDLVRLLEDLARMSGRDFTTTTTELLDEALRMRRFPGIIFADGPAGRRARIAGTGVDVWELIAAYDSVDRDTARLRQAFRWLPEPSVRAALAYYAAYPEEIDRRVAASKRWTVEELKARYPALMPERE